jgi:hypothetical protein
MVRCSVAINTRQQHKTTLFTEQNKVEDAQSLSGLMVSKWTSVSLRLALNYLIFRQNQTIIVFWDVMSCSLVDM